MKTIADCRKLSVELEAVSATARLDVDVLLAWTLDKDRTFLYSRPETQLTVIQHQQFTAALERRKQREPVAYITGTQEFWSLPLLVDRSTLIPRADTEVLVETALNLVDSTATVLDLGTGSGAIALALATEKPHWQIVAVDKSAEAVALATKNRQRLGLANVGLMVSDWFAALPQQRFDLIVSNPPYVNATERQLDLMFEPASALVAAEQGLADLKFIIAEARPYLANRGWLMVEHGWQQGAAVQQQFTVQGYHQVRMIKDYSGHDRVTIGQFIG